MNRYILYPGCAMESSARAYYDSLKAITDIIGLDLQEIEDWNCCGATEYLGIKLTPAYALISRNLALAAQQADGTRTVVAPCSACYLNLAKADYYMQEQPVLGQHVNEALAAGGLSYAPGSLDIRHLLDVLVYDVGLDTIKSKMVRPLTGLRVAPYLGCMVPRPDYDHRWSEHEYPVELDLLLNALGAEVIEFPLKTECSGGHMTQISPDTAFELIRRLVSAADSHQADLMATLCPMCQMNLDAYQSETNKYFGTSFRMPVIFFTQLMGLAFGLEAKDLGFGLELVSARNALAKIGIEHPAEVPVGTARPKKDGSLPMPAPLPPRNMPAEKGKVVK